MLEKDDVFSFTGLTVMYLFLHTDTDVLRGVRLIDLRRFVTVHQMYQAHDWKLIVVFSSAEVESCIRTFKETKFSWQTDDTRTHSRVTFYNLEVYILLHHIFSNCILSKFTSFIVTIEVFSYAVLCRCRAVGSMSVVLKKSKYLCEMFHVVSLKLLLHRRCVTNWQQKLVIFVR